MSKTTVVNSAIKHLEQVFEGRKQIKLEDVINALNEFKASSNRKKLPEPREIDGIMHKWCRYFEDYFPEDDMVKGKNYSKKAISLWTKARSAIPTITRKMLSAEGKQLEELRALLGVLTKYNEPEVYKDGSLEKAVGQAKKL